MGAATHSCATRAPRSVAAGLRAAGPLRFGGECSPGTTRSQAARPGALSRRRPAPGARHRGKPRGAGLSSLQRTGQKPPLLGQPGVRPLLVRVHCAAEGHQGAVASGLGGRRASLRGAARARVRARRLSPPRQTRRDRHRAGERWRERVMARVLTGIRRLNPGKATEQRPCAVRERRAYSQAVDEDRPTDPRLRNRGRGRVQDPNFALPEGAPSCPS